MTFLLTQGVRGLMDREGREEVIDKVFLWKEKSPEKTKLIVITETKKSEKKK